MRHEHMRYLSPEAIALEGEGLRCLWDRRVSHYSAYSGVMRLIRAIFPHRTTHTREQVEREIKPMLRRAYATMREARG